ncbi:hypothetical protein SKAU_G00238090 [Synaphobranchus kaupii]|uniref:Uncharacterized protein n=1 Tax=Synaphobranchus kaupii TaxID=118154 RepID=A0A9Q1F729_SYNKA|nr:hypothetical protein SKAU_G00238090 [Synaphobranchus kaupii]
MNKATVCITVRDSGPTRTTVKELWLVLPLNLTDPGDLNGERKDCTGCEAQAATESAATVNEKLAGVQ